MNANQPKKKEFKPVIIFHNGYDSINNQEYAIRVKEMLSTNCRWWLSSTKTFVDEKQQNSYNPQSLPSPPRSDSMDQSPESPPASKPLKRKRGNLPKQTTALLKSWLADHKKHPYPTEDQKLYLVRETGLTLQQISNWFINARRRHLPLLLENDFANGQPMRNSHGYPPYAEIPSDHS
ncbi:9579_t:CDS:2, partial [Ambispora leptoticha]